MRDTFSAGVKPTGLKTRNEIKTLICYLVFSIKVGLTSDDILKALEENELANYFDILDCLDQIKTQKLIGFDDKTKKFIPNEKTEIIASRFEFSLPRSAREQALNTCIKLIEKIKKDKESKVEIEKVESGYYVNCYITGHNMNLANFKLFVPDEKQAEIIKNNFKDDPATLYHCALAILTKDYTLAGDTLENLMFKLSQEKNNSNFNDL